MSDGTPLDGGLDLASASVVGTAQKTWTYRKRERIMEHTILLRQDVEEEKVARNARDKYGPNKIIDRWGNPHETVALSSFMQEGTITRRKPSIEEEED